MAGRIRSVQHALELGADQPTAEDVARSNTTVGEMVEQMRADSTTGNPEDPVPVLPLREGDEPEAAAEDQEGAW
jgi:hypothetical protein